MSTPWWIAAAVGQGIGADAEAAGEDPLDGRDRRGGGDPAHPLVELGLDRVEGAGEAGPRGSPAPAGRRCRPPRGGVPPPMPGSAPLPSPSTPATMASCRVRSSYPASWPWSFLTLDSKSRFVLRSCSFSLFRRAISTGLTFRLKWSQVKRAAARVRRRKAPASDPDLQAGHLPLAQLGVRVGDQDDRVVPFCHESSYKEPVELDTVEPAAIVEPERLARSVL